MNPNFTKPLQTNQDTIQVLLVTSDLAKCGGLIRYLQRPDWKLSRAHSGQKAIREVASGRFDLVFCEKNLSDISSTDFLQVIKNRFPWVKVIFFGSNANDKYIQDAIGLGLDYFIPVPVMPFEVEKAISTVLSTPKSDDDKPDKQVNIIIALRSLPAVPQVVAKLWTILDSTDVTIPSVVSIVRTDPGLTAMVLRVANSVRYGSHVKIRNLERAISLMGLTELRSLSIAHSTSKVFKRSSTEGNKFKLEDHWHHSIDVALTAEDLAKNLVDVKMDQAFSAGLLHDLGVLVLTEVYQEKYNAVIEKMESEGGKRYEIEQELLEMDHQAAGAIICKQWSLPEYLFTPIRFHHSPTGARDELNLTSIVHLADLMVHQLSKADDAELIIDEATAVALERLLMDEDSLSDRLQRLDGYLQTAAAAYGDLFRPPQSS